MRRTLVINDFATAPHSEFPPVYEENLIFFFISVLSHVQYTLLRNTQ